KYSLILKGEVHPDVPAVLNVFDKSRRVLEYVWNGVEFNRFHPTQLKAFSDMMRSTGAVVWKLSNIQSLQSSQFICQCMQPNGFDKLECVIWEETQLDKAAPGITDECWDAMSHLPYL